MSSSWRAAVRTLVIVGGCIVTGASVVAFRAADWPIYLVFLLVSVVLFLPYVEVLPTVALPIPEMAATIGFLYIGGLPIIMLRNVAPILTRFLRWALPERWKQRLPQLRAEAAAVRRELFTEALGADPAVSATVAAEWATFALGLGVRWWIVSSLVPHALPASDPGAMMVAETGGYACWGLLSLLPIYPDRPMVALSAEGGSRAALIDMGLIVILALTPFVFLIAYEFRAHGLSGAAGWSLSTLGLHFMLKRLNERRLTVEEQNRRLESLNRELEHRERLSAIGKMSSVVSHQILQQLGVIGIYADLIRNADPQGDAAAVLVQARKNAGAIEGALGDVNRVLTDLLVFSKDLRLNLYEHPLERVVAESLDECRVEAAQRGVTLCAECPPGINLMLDKLKMKQAITNVLRNAVEASRPAGEVVLRATIRNGSVEVAISDQGPGIPERDREAVFAPFFTTKEQGTGLGLAIARQFTEAHGGHLRAESGRDGRGATFVFSLPLRRQ
jgi:signal transduction histidine kinase